MPQARPWTRFRPPETAPAGRACRDPRWSSTFRQAQRATPAVELVEPPLVELVETPSRIHQAVRLDPTERRCHDDLMPTVDLNADLGESFGAWTLGDDSAMLPLITSANLACGFHAGDPTGLRRICAEASDHGVTIGAQVGYRDLVGFGRRAIDIAPADLTADVIYQLGSLDGLCRSVGTRVRYLKPHGALYNTVAHDEAQAAAVVAAVLAYDLTLPILGLPGSALLRRATDAGLVTVAEAFADRGYTPTGTLVPRSEPGALVTDPETVAERVVRLATEQSITAVDGTVVAVNARSICVHGDTPGAVAAARRIRQRLDEADIRVRAFV